MYDNLFVHVFFSNYKYNSMHKVFLAIGGNIGNKALNFQKVHILIAEKIGTISLHSSIYETSAWGFESADYFWNKVLEVRSSLSATEILEKIREIDLIFGRKRSESGYQSREMDIDILYFDDKIIQTENLTIPHPLLHKRLFVLVPLAEIASDFVHPVLKLSSLEMLKICDDKSVIKKLEL